MQKDILLKFYETLSLFTQPELPDKGEGLPNLDRSCHVIERVSIIPSLFFPVSLG